MRLRRIPDAARLLRSLADEAGDEVLGRSEEVPDQWRGIATRCEKTATIYLAGLHIAVTNVPEQHK